jgi:hypothetical protein
MPPTFSGWLVISVCPPRLSRFPTRIPTGLPKHGLPVTSLPVQAKTQVTFAITASESGSLLGAVTLLNIAPSHARAELGYRVGFDHEP